MRQGLWWVILCCLNMGEAELLAVDLIQLGPRPYFLVEYMDERFLKERLRACFEKSIQIEISTSMCSESGSGLGSLMVQLKEGQSC